MQLSMYKEAFASYFNNEQFIAQLNEAVKKVQSVSRIFFIGNGGSNSICSHMMEDFGKIARKKTFAFSDASLITCYANDYGYEHAMAEWLKLHMEPGDMLVAISSSGKSPNILNSVQVAKEKAAFVITLSGFEKGNPLSGSGNINFHIPVKNYGIVECYHQVILHIILDTVANV